MTKAAKRIGILCGGGDCPGLNAVIRAATKSAILEHGMEVMGFKKSFGGILTAEGLLPLTLDSVRGILHRGGTILGTTSRGNPFEYPVRNELGGIGIHNYSDKIVRRARELGLSSIIVIGGDGTLTIAQRLFEKGLPVVGVPKTIDNDLLATDLTFGFYTAVETATQAIDKLHTTAESHGRVMVMEVMGRNSGWIALEAGISGGADVILLPEIPFQIESICKQIEWRKSRGRQFSIVVVAEGASLQGGEQIFQPGASDRLGGVSYSVAEGINRMCGVETRVLVLGHLQRGGGPSAYDRLLATRFGVGAAELAAAGKVGEMVRLRCGKIESVPIVEAVRYQRQIEPNGEKVRAARALGISFGD